MISRRIVNANTGWDPEELRITDRTANHGVDFEVDDVTGAFRFDYADAYMFYRQPRAHGHTLITRRAIEVATTDE